MKMNNSGLEEKKQVVFIEPSPTVNMYRIARTLKLTGRYETILASFSNVDKNFYKKAYDKILVLELSHKFNTSTLLDLSKKIFRGEIKSFLKKIEKINPYLFHITGPDLFSSIAMIFLEKNPAPKIYYSNDTWGATEKTVSFLKEFGIKGELQRIFEKICFKNAEGVLNKGSIKQYDLLKYKIDSPKMSLFPNCFDSWIYPVKKKKNKEIHIAFGAGPAHSIALKELSHFEIMKIITSQKIHLHTYGPCIDKEINEIFIKESKENKYYHFHGLMKPDKLNKEMAKYDYGIFLFFMDPLKKKPFPETVKSILNSKMMNYLESGLPMIIDKEYGYMTDIIKKHGLGVEISVEDLKNLRKILEKQNYNKLQKNVKKFQNEFKWSKKIKEIEAFYEKVVKENKNS